MTERKRAEEQQTTMVAELNHRVTNIVAIVQSVAAQTVRSSSTLKDFADAFTGRLRALAIAHDILTETRWIGIGLNELLVAVLAPYRTPEDPRIGIMGPAILLPARAVVPLSTRLHEMTTNARVPKGFCVYCVRVFDQDLVALVSSDGSAASRSDS